MPRVQYFAATSLDGFIARADGDIDWLLHYDGSFDGGVDPDPARYVEGVGSLAVGADTYEFMARHSQWLYGPRPVWVFTHRKDLPVPEGADVRFVAGDVGAHVEAMRAAAGERVVWVVGGGDLASQFADAGLLDDVMVTIVPVVLGDGIGLFRRPPAVALHLRGVTPYFNGMIGLHYSVGALSTA